MAIDFNLPASMSWITQQSEVGTAAKDVIIERFAYITDFVEESKSDLDAALARLEGAAGRVTVGDINIGTIDVPDIVDQIPSFTETFNELFTATLDNFEASYVEPGDMPDPSGYEWQDDDILLEDDLVSVLANWLTSGASAIPDNIAEQIANAALVRLNEKKNESILVLESEAATKGFLNPSFVDWARRVQIESEYAKGVAEINAKIADRDMELTQANYHKAAELASGYVNSAKEYVVQRNLALVQHYKARVEAWTSLVDARIKEMQGHIEAYRGRVEAYVAQGQVYKTKGEVYEAKAKAYEAAISGLNTKFGTIAETVKMRTKVFEVESLAAIEEEKLRVQAQIANSGFAQKVAEVAAELSSRAVANGLATVHVQGGMSTSHSTGQQVGYSYSRSENMSEQHSESENISIEG